MEIGERPWGTYTVLEENRSYKIKRIEVHPGQRLSLQMHHHRSEHWIVVSGTAQVTCGDREFILNVNESTFIPMGTLTVWQIPAEYRSASSRSRVASTWVRMTSSAFRMTMTAMRMRTKRPRFDRSWCGHGAPPPEGT